MTEPAGMRACSWCLTKIEMDRKQRGVKKMQGGWLDVVDDWVPVDRMPIGYWIPGFLRFEITLRQKGSTVQSETNGLRSTLDGSMVMV